MDLVCPVHINGGAGHDASFPTRIFMALVNSLLNIFDKGDCEGRNGPVEIYRCGVLKETGVWKVIRK